MFANVLFREIYFAFAVTSTLILINRKFNGDQNLANQNITKIKNYRYVIIIQSISLFNKKLSIMVQYLA